MSRDQKSGGANRIVRAAAVMTVLVLAGYAAVWHGAESVSVRSTASQAREDESAQPVTQELLGLTKQAGANFPEIRVDDLLTAVSQDGLLVIDRAALERKLRDVTGVQGPIDRVRVAQLFEAQPRSRVVFQGMTFELNRETATMLADLFLGEGGAFDDLTIGDLLAALDEARLRPDAASESLGIPGLTAVLRNLSSGSEERLELARDSRFSERQRLLEQYAVVDAAVEQVRSEGPAAGLDAEAYDKVFAQLVADGRVDAVPLLEGRQRFEKEMVEADLSAMSLAERITYRQEARRRAFGPETAAMLFSGRESMELFRIAVLAQEEDSSLSDEQRSEEIQRLRRELKVELAGRGSYVGFADESRADDLEQLRERLGDDELDAMTDEQRAEALRQEALNKLPPEMRAHVERVRAGGQR